jgi:hypothetical protein
MLGRSLRIFLLAGRRLRQDLGQLAAILLIILHADAADHVVALGGEQVGGAGDSSNVMDQVVGE